MVRVYSAVALWIVTGLVGPAFAAAPNCPWQWLLGTWQIEEDYGFKSRVVWKKLGVGQGATGIWEDDEGNKFTELLGWDATKKQIVSTGFGTNSAYWIIRFTEVTGTEIEGTMTYRTPQGITYEGEYSIKKLGSNACESLYKARNLNTGEIGEFKGRYSKTDSIQQQVRDLVSNRKHYALYKVQDVKQAQEAKRLLDRAIESHPTNARLFAARGKLFADRNRAEEAAHDFQEFAKLDADSTSESNECTIAWMDGAAAQLMKGHKQKDSRVYIHQMLLRFEATKNAGVAERISKAALFGGLGPQDLQKVARLAELASSRGWATGLFAKGLTAYRMERFETAEACAKTIIATKNKLPFLDLQSQLLLAMAHYRTGDETKYRKMLDEVKSAIKDTKFFWLHNKVFTTTLLKQAEDLGK
ncbi:MAG: hypothetical protein VX346_22865 [Planctomycetota bacterium]|nr:hypothetical protein [Planctomycetota bacterium]